MSEAKNGGEGTEAAPTSLADAVVRALGDREAAEAAASTAAEPKASVEPEGSTPSEGAAEPTASPSEASTDAASTDAAATDAAATDAAATDAAATDGPPEDAAPEEPARAEEPSSEPSDAPQRAAHDEPTAPRIALDGPAPEGVRVRYFGRTDVGLIREHNEDNYLVVDVASARRGVEDAPIDLALDAKGCVLAVCDGMGGAAAGEVASQMAVDTLYEMVTAADAAADRDQFARRLVRAIEEAGSRIFGAAKVDRTRRGMGTTSTVAGLVDEILFVGQVGDSRAYVLRGDQFAQITKDQSLVNQLIEAGQLTEEEAEAFEHSNIILQALGTTEEVAVDLTFLELRRGDRLLLCSDGLSGLVHAEMMKETLLGCRDLTEAAAKLIEMANAGGGHDNITVVLADFDGQGLKPPGDGARVAYQQYPLPPGQDSAEPTPIRSAPIKPSTPKPGSSAAFASVRPAAASESPFARWWIVALLVVIVVALLIAIVMSMGSTAEGTAGPTTRATLSSTQQEPAEHTGETAGASDSPRWEGERLRELAHDEALEVTPSEVAVDEAEGGDEGGDEGAGAGDRGADDDAPAVEPARRRMPTGVEPPPLAEEPARRPGDLAHEPAP